MTEEKKKPSLIIVGVACLIVGLAAPKIWGMIDKSAFLEQIGICDFSDYIEQKKI